VSLIQSGDHVQLGLTGYSRIDITVDYHQTSQRRNTGLTINCWPVLLDHYKFTYAVTVLCGNQLLYPHINGRGSVRLTILILLFVSAQVVAQLPTLPADTRLLHIPILEIQIGEDKFYFEIDLLGAEDLSSFALTGAAGIDIQTYDRDDWPHWKDFDGDCQNTRHELLIAESLWNVTFTSESNCTTNTGIWVGPYTGEVFTFASDVDIDHVIPLKYAHDHGGNI